MPNEGYVFTPKLNKEYLKLKPGMSADKFYDAEMQQKFERINASFAAIAKSTPTALHCTALPLSSCSR